MKQIDINILKDVLSDIADETNNHIVFKSSIIGSMSNSYLKLDHPISSEKYHELIKLSLKYYFTETGDNIYCLIDYTSRDYNKSTIHCLNFITGTKREVYSIRKDRFKNLMTRFGFFRDPVYLQMHEMGNK